MKKFVFLLLLVIQTVNLTGKTDNTFTKADSLRGKLTSLRTCFDVTCYHLDIKVDPGRQFISGSNEIQFRATTDFDRMQIDLADNMKIEKIIFNEKKLRFHRQMTAVYIDYPAKLKKNKIYAITIFYSGKPQIAKRPPWDGGLVWSKDENGNPWVAVTVQGDGALLWWPNKEHQSDEPDSMLLSIAVPDTLMNISNGRLRNKTRLNNGWTRWDWFISYPINNYNVTLNIAKYTRFDDIFVSANGDTLTLDYYVLPYNLEKAKKQFEQVKPMLSCFEKLFGKYPFYRDGFKLIECPHTGMEHQSAIAYGNFYRNGYRGRASSEYGLLFDFIIVHEAAHEWWGNSVTSKDIADMWIHESFAAYAEALYIECLYGYDAYLSYQNGKKFGVKNDRPIIGQYDVNNPGSHDMYNKGSLILHTLRHVIANDNLWFAILSGIQEEFKYQTVAAEDIFSYINKKTGVDYNYFFEQYFRHSGIPELEIIVTRQGQKVSTRYKWHSDVKNFNMPVKVTTKPGTFEFIYPETDWKTTELNISQPGQFKIAEDLFYLKSNLSFEYLIE